MTAKEFGFLADAIKTYFPRDNVLPTENAMRLWYEELKDIPYQAAYIALRKYVSINKFAPTIADIREQASELKTKNEEELNETAAWALVLKAMRRAAYYAEEEFEKLPVVVKRAVFSPGQLREWAILEDIDGKTMTVIQANFQRTFRNEMRIEKEKGKLSPDVLKLYNKNDSPKVETSKREVSQIEENDNEKDTVEAPDDIMERAIRRMERE